MPEHPISIRALARFDRIYPDGADRPRDVLGGKGDVRVSSTQLMSIDLFSGAGGMAEGFLKAGFKTALANDFDEMAAKTFNHNHPDIPFIVRDLRRVSSSEILEKSGLGVGDATVVCGGPPCQGFSIAGQRLANDPRNELFRDFVRVVKDVQPRFFVFENVAGLVSMQNGNVLAAILREFNSIGYSYSFRTVNAADYGVPQSRPRFVILGSRDREPFDFPAPTHRPQISAGLLLDSLDDRPFHVTSWEALSDLPDLDQGEGIEEAFHTKAATNEYQRARRGHRRPGMVFNHRATAHSTQIQERYAAIPEGGDASSIPVHLRTKKANVFKIARDRPSRTVTCNHRTDLLHPVFARGTTVREAARLQSFDDDYQFFGNLTRKAKWVTQDDQVGNAVPPLLAEALAYSIRKQIAPSEAELADAA